LLPRQPKPTPLRYKPFAKCLRWRKRVTAEKGDYAGHIPHSRLGPILFPVEKGPVIHIQQGRNTLLPQPELAPPPLQVVTEGQWHLGVRQWLQGLKAQRPEWQEGNASMPIVLSARGHPRAEPALSARPARSSHLGAGARRCPSRSEACGVGPRALPSGARAGAGSAARSGPPRGARSAGRGCPSS